MNNEVIPNHFKTLGFLWTHKRYSGGGEPNVLEKY